VTNSTVSFRKIVISRVSYFALTLSILAVATVAAIAQRSITDGATPLALAPGAPAGSYAQSELETINAYNGSLNFRLPLLAISGRGGAGYVLSLPIQTRWRTVHKSNDQQMIEIPVSNWWTFHPRGYGAGQLEGRVATDPDRPCPPLFHTTTLLSRLTFTAPDGTEYELRDQLTGGQPQSYFCGGGAPYPSRGTVFVTADGSAATFISDTIIRDDGSALNPTGYLSLRDGTRYRIVNSDVTWMRDRNGNMLTFTYGDKQMIVTDSLNRQVTVRYADYPTGRFYDEITYKGFGGAQRTIRVNYAPLQSVLRTNRPGDVSNVQTAAALFPQLTGSATTPSNPYVTSSVVLQDGVQQYQFLYNVYGELARVTLPTGGSFEYDFGNGAEGDSTGVIWSVYSLPEIYRRVLRRRVYSDQGSTLESLTTYSRPELETPGYVEINHFKPDQSTLLGRERHYFHGAAFSSFNLGPLDYSPWRDGREYKTEHFAANGSTLLKSVLQLWDQRSLAWWIGNAETAPPNNPYVKETVTTLADANLITKTSHINPQNGQTMIDQFNNILDTWVYDYGKDAPGALLNHTHTDYLTSNNGVDYSNRASLASPHLLSLAVRQSTYDASEVEKARTTFEYDNYSAVDAFHAGLKDWPALTGIPISGLDPSCTSSYPSRGNVTATTRYLLSGNQVVQPITAYSQYDIAGNAVKTIDARSTPSNVMATTIDFNDCFGIPDAEARANIVPDNLAAVQRRTYAFPTQTTNALGHQTYHQFDYYLGRPINVEDANGTVYSAAYNDPFDRASSVIKAVNRDLGFQSLTSFAYDDAAHRITTNSDLRTFGDQVLSSQVIYDGLGRKVETRQFEGGGNFIAQRTIYDALNRVAQTSNPFRPWKNELPIWNTTVFDGLSRAESSTTADGATSTISYSGNEVLTTDQAGKKRKSVSDALGRLTKVYEDPNGLNWFTSYAYDVLGNLTTVTQDSQTRSFQYDSLSRLTSANNPESGLKAYLYDNNGNLISETDARGVITNAAYDALNRPVSKSYQNDPANTPAVHLYYDAQELPTGAPGFLRGSAIGNLVAATYGNEQAAGNYYGFDLIGRSVLKIQRTGNVNYQISTAYNAAGRVISLTYPSGRVVSYNYDAAGRPGDRDAQNLAMTGTLGDGVLRTYSSGVTYTNRNALAQERLGTENPVYNKLFYNSRGQLAEIRASTSPNNTSWNRGAIINHYSDQCWGMCGGGNSTTSMKDNNGNLRRQDVYIPSDEQFSSVTTWADGFLYDNLNRLTQVHEYTDNISLDWQQEYLYDRWGNRRINQAATYGPNIPEPGFTVDSNNRLAAPAGYTLSYDPSGNLINDSYTGQGQRLYDAENRMTKAWSNSQWQTYSYDAAGQRIKRNVSGTEIWQVYGFDGELLAEYGASGAPSAPQKEYGYRNGQLLVTAEPAAATARTNYALGSNSAVASASSTLSSAFPASGLNNGDRKGLSWGNGGGWRDAEPVNSFPDWAEIDFPTARTIDEIDVFTVQDNYANPSAPTEAMTFSVYGVTGFLVEYWNGNGWAPVPGGNVSGSNKVWRKLSFTPLVTTKIRVSTNSSADGYSRLVEIEAWGTSASPRTNVALPLNGGMASASSQLSPAFPASGTNNGDRKGSGWESGGGWRDAEPRLSFPDWLQIDFNGSKTIDEIDVFTVQDNYANPSEPTENMTFSLYGVTGYDVQYWNGSSWTTVSGGSVTGNNKVWRKITFPAVTTSKVRVHANASADGYSRLVEVEAWTASSSVNAPANINWLVVDQLGTPRMIFDRSGSLASMTRHDYLPFGEELPAGTGARSNSQGYGLSDALRQKFTGKERDGETGMDYFLARYYQSSQGRFTSPDPLLASGRLANPQTWNRYAYVLNNPLRLVDPNGMEDHEALPTGQDAENPGPIDPPQELVAEIMNDLSNVTYTLDGQVGTGVMQIDQKVNDELSAALAESFGRGVGTGTLASATNGLVVPMTVGSQASVGLSGSVGGTPQAGTGAVGSNLSLTAQKSYEVAVGRAISADINNRAANGSAVSQVASQLQGIQVTVNTSSGPIQATIPRDVWLAATKSALNKAYEAGIREGLKTVSEQKIAPARKPH
jgi:RHS repeat-associated protein